jgi:hypothetical protein
MSSGGRQFNSTEEVKNMKHRIADVTIMNILIIYMILQIVTSTK